MQMNREKLEKAQLTIVLGMNYKMLKMFCIEKQFQ